MVGLVADGDQCHRRAWEALSGTVAAIDDGQWHAATPCTEWDVRDLLNHNTAGATNIRNARVSRERGDGLQRPLRGFEPIAVFVN